MAAIINSKYKSVNETESDRSNDQMRSRFSKLPRSGSVIPGVVSCNAIPSSVAALQIQVKEQKTVTDYKSKPTPVFLIGSAIVFLTIVISIILMDFTVGNLDRVGFANSGIANAVNANTLNSSFDYVEDAFSLDSRITTSSNVKNRSSVTVKEPLVQPLIYKTQSAKDLVVQVHNIISTTNRRQSQAKQLAERIVAESHRQKYDPFFVAAVIKSESAFNEMAVSHVGAQGLMQIMPATGKYLINKHKEHFPRAVKLTDPDVNIKLGIKYLRELEKMYDGNRLLTLIAYNWGPGKLDRAIKSGRGVPKQCIQYALKILKDHNLWQA